MNVKYCPGSKKFKNKFVKKLRNIRKGWGAVDARLGQKTPKDLFGRGLLVEIIIFSRAVRAAFPSDGAGGPGWPLRHCP